MIVIQCHYYTQCKNFTIRFIITFCSPSKFILDNNYTVSCCNNYEHVSASVYIHIYNTHTYTPIIKPEGAQYTDYKSLHAPNCVCMLCIRLNSLHELLFLQLFHSCDHILVVCRLPMQSCCWNNNIIIIQQSSTFHILPIIMHENTWPSWISITMKKKKLNLFEIS